MKYGSYILIIPCFCLFHIIVPDTSYAQDVRGHLSQAEIESIKKKVKANRTRRRKLARALVKGLSEVRSEIKLATEQIGGITSPQGPKGDPGPSGLGLHAVGMLGCRSRHARQDATHTARSKPARRN